MTKNNSSVPLTRRVGFATKHARKTQAMAFQAVDRAILAFHILIIAAVRKWHMTPIQKRQFRAMTGTRAIGKWPLLSDLSARRRASYILIRLMAEHRRSRPTVPPRRYFFLTFIDDIGNTSDRVPEVNLGAIQRKVDKAIRAMRLHAVGVTEVQALMNYPGKGRGRTLMYHTHLTGWTYDPLFNPKAAEKKINQSPSWNNSFDAPPVKITPMTDEEGQIDWLAYYITKLPYDAKNRMPNKKKPGKHILMQTTKGYRPELALRVFEGLSQVELPAVLFGVGEGAEIRKRWRSKLLAWHNRRSVVRPPESPFNVAQLWIALRAINGSKLFGPYQFIEGSARSASIHANEKMEPDIPRPS